MCARARVSLRLGFTPAYVVPEHTHTHTPTGSSVDGDGGGGGAGMGHGHGTGTQIFTASCSFAYHILLEPG